MKIIGIIGAMEEEIINIKKYLNNICSKNIMGLEFYKGTIDNIEIVLVRSGIGKVNAAICSQTLINIFNVNCIINTGVAGAINKQLDIGDIVISRDAIYHDFDTTVFGDTKGHIPNMKQSIFESDKKLIDIVYDSAKQLTSNNIVIGRIASGDQFICDINKKNYIYKEFNAECVEMEGAAIAHTCYLNQIPFVIIRSISDKAEEGNTNNYNEFFKNSAKIASEIIINMIKNI